MSTGEFLVAAPSTITCESLSSSTTVLKVSGKGKVTLYAAKANFEIRYRIYNSTRGTSADTNTDINGAQTISLTFEEGDTLQITINNGYGYGSMEGVLTWEAL